MRRLLPLLIIALAVAGFIGLRATRPSAPAVETRERVWQVETHTLQAAALHPTLVLYGRVEAPDRLRAAAPVSARILELRVRDGDRVEAGAVLARLDPRDLAPRLERAKADLERERIRHRSDQQALEQERTLVQLADARLTRLERLKDARLGAESAVDQAREERARAQLALTQRQQAIAEHPARLAQLQTQLAEAMRDAERGELVAPFAARIGTVEVAAGDQVQAGQTLLSLYSSDALYLRARVPALYAEELRAALTRGEHLHARADFGATPLRAHLERISGEADARGVDVLLRIEDADRVPVGAFVNAALDRPLANDIFAIPPTALHGGDRLYLIENGRLRGLNITRAGERRSGDQVQLLVRGDALANGMQVLSTHLPHAIDGLAVAVVERTAQ